MKNGHKNGEHSPYQESYNGPLIAEVRDRINKVRSKTGYSLAKIGQKLDISGAFLSTLLRPGNPASIRSIHIDGLMHDLGELEVEAGIKAINVDSKVPPQSSENASGSGECLEKLVKAIHAKGFSVTLTPLQSH